MNRSPQWIRKTVHTITARRIPWKPPMGFCGARAVAHAAWFIERLRGDWRFPCRLCRIRVIGAVLAASRSPPVCPQLRTSRRTVPTAEIVAHHVHRMTSLPADGCGRGSQTSHAMRNQIANARRQRDRLKTRLPVGQIGKSLSSPFRKNISVHFSPKSLLHLLPSRTRKRGVSRSSRTLGAGCDGRGGVRRANSAPDE
jgi:hypothetical protein